MRSRLFFTTVLLLLCGTELFGQAASTYHVFPQFVDGTYQDGSFYRSTLFATNANTSDASCTYQLYGMSNDRLLPTNAFSLPANGGVFRASTAGNALGFAAGYATLSCDRPVFTYLQYEYISPAGTIMGSASVYSAPPGTGSEFIFPTAADYHLGVAIANDSDSSLQVTLRLGAAGSNELQTSITIEPRSRIARFIEEIFSIPSGFVPVALLMQSLTTPTIRFNAIGLVFSGTVFSTAPPLVFRP